MKNEDLTLVLLVLGELRSYRMDRVEDARITDTSFAPRYGLTLNLIHVKGEDLAPEVL